MKNNRIIIDCPLGGNCNNCPYVNIEKCRGVKLNESR